MNEPEPLLTLDEFVTARRNLAEAPGYLDTCEAVDDSDEWARFPAAVWLRIEADMLATQPPQFH